MMCEVRMDNKTSVLHTSHFVLPEWGGKDSNLRRLSQQIYSLLPLTAREPPQHISANEADGGIRTPDLLITSEPLWPPELHRRILV